MGDAGAGADGVALGAGGRLGLLAALQVACSVHHQLAEAQDAEIGRAQVLARAVGNRPLAVLHGGVLLRHALDAGIARRLLQLAVDQVVVGLVAQGYVVLVDLGDTPLPLLYSARSASVNGRSGFQA